MSGITQQQGVALPGVAHAAIAEQLGVAVDRPAEHDWMVRPGASFVTLRQQDTLRGCIGTLHAHRALVEDVRHNAVAAALHDRRFQPLRPEELASTSIEVSVLSGFTSIAFDSEAEALERLRPGIDGVVLHYGNLRSTFLPQVWESLPRPQDFLAQLKQKAGLPATFWDGALRLERYTVTKWRQEAGQGDAHA